MLPIRAVASFIGLVALVSAVIRAQGPGTFPLATLMHRWFARPPTLALVCIAVVAGIGGVVIVPLIGVAGGWGHFAGAGPLSGQWIALALTGVVVKAAFVLFEEVVFRGALISQLVRWKGPGVAIAVSALVFALAHSGRSVTDTVILFADGIGFGLAFVITGSLWVAAIWHLSKNVSVWLFLGSGTVDMTHGAFDWRIGEPGWAFGSEVSAGVFEVAATILVVGCVCWMLVRGRTRNQTAT
jgi:membrane protease YdiL (CAAX protease family)